MKAAAVDELEVIAPLIELLEQKLEAAINFSTVRRRRIEQLLNGWIQLREDLAQLKTALNQHPVATLLPDVVQALNALERTVEWNIRPVLGRMDYQGTWQPLLDADEGGCYGDD